MPLQTKAFNKASISVVSPKSCTVAVNSQIYYFAGVGMPLDQLQDYHLKDAIRYCKLRGWNDCKLSIKEVLGRAYSLKR
jgi:hypothetical protein